MFPLEPTAAEAQAAIAEEFALLRRLVRALPVPDRPRPQAAAVPGCVEDRGTPPARLPVDGLDRAAKAMRARLDFEAISDSAIVVGPDLPGAARVLGAPGAGNPGDTEPDYIADIGLAKHLSPTRSNGLAALLAFIRDTRAGRRVSDAADAPRTRRCATAASVGLLALPHAGDAVVPDRRGDGRLAHLRTHPRSAGAGPDRPGRSHSVFLRRAVRRLSGRPPAAAQARA